MTYTVLSGTLNSTIPYHTIHLESGVRVTCDVAYLCANFRLPRPVCSRLRSNVCDRQTSDVHHRLMPGDFDLLTLKVMSLLRVTWGHNRQHLLRI